MSRPLFSSLAGFASVLVLACVAQADTLPYTTRTQPYNAWPSTVRGDIRTVGMAGAAVGLGDTFIASTMNPAGPAMTLQGADLSFNSNSVKDARVQNFENPVTTNNFGFAWSMYPWGITLGYVQSYREGQSYQVGASPTDIADLSITTREFVFGVSRVLFENRFSFGVDLLLGQSEHQISSGLIASGSAANHAYALGGRLGAMVQLPERFIVGMSYSLPMHYAADAAATSSSVLPGFFQPINVPETFALGLGWIPNRYFRTDLTIYAIGRTPEAALLSHNAIDVGQNRTYQPRLGAAYTLADFKEFSANVFLGTYFEASRIHESHDRLHFTTGIEVKPWILSLGWGLDLAPDYRNYLVSLSIDVVKTMTKLDIIPRTSSTHASQFLPRPGNLSEAGLARPLMRNWRPQRQIDPIEAGLAVPGKVAEKIENVLSAIVPNAHAEPKVPMPAPVAPPPNWKSKRKATHTPTRSKRSAKNKKSAKSARAPAAAATKEPGAPSRSRRTERNQGRPAPAVSPAPPSPPKPPSPPHPLKLPKNKARYSPVRDAPDEPPPPGALPAPPESLEPPSETQENRE